MKIDQRNMQSAEITLEATIVTTTVMIIIMLLISFVIYTHDALVIKAYAYGAANEEIEEEYDLFTERVAEKVKAAPLFMIKPTLEFNRNLDSYKITIKGKCNVKIFGFEKLFSEMYVPKSMCIEKNMSTKILYISREILEQVERK